MIFFYTSYCWLSTRTMRQVAGGRVWGISWWCKPQQCHIWLSVIIISFTTEYQVLQMEEESLPWMAICSRDRPRSPVKRGPRYNAVASFDRRRTCFADHGLTRPSWTFSPAALTVIKDNNIYVHNNPCGREHKQQVSFTGCFAAKLFSVRLHSCGFGGGRRGYFSLLTKRLLRRQVPVRMFIPAWGGIPKHKLTRAARDACQYYGWGTDVVLILIPYLPILRQS